MVPSQAVQCLQQNCSCLPLLLGPRWWSPQGGGALTFRDRAGPSVSPPEENSRQPHTSLSAFLPLHGAQEATEQLVPKEDEAGGAGSLQQAGREALEESTWALLSHDLPHAVQETPIRPYLGEKWQQGQTGKLQDNWKTPQRSPNYTTETLSWHAAWRCLSG